MLFALISLLLSSVKLNRIFRRKASQNNCDNFHFVFFFFDSALEFSCNFINFHWVISFSFTLIHGVRRRIHSFPSGETKGHGCIIVDDLVKSPSDAVGQQTLKSKPKLAFMTKWCCWLRRFATHSKERWQSCYTYWSRLLSQCVQVKQGHWLAVWLLGGNGAPGSVDGCWVRPY